jgi:DNA-directed RNA polymerase subunit RPC12/RpoP
MERRKLFSENNTKPIRRKLFSEDCPSSNAESLVHTVICIDCGYKMDTMASTTDLICPRCGGTSFVPESDTVVDPIVLPEHQEEESKPIEEKTYSRRKLFSTYEEDEAEFQREFSEPTSELESKLKEFSGRVISQGEFQKEFSDIASLEELQEREYAEVCDSGYIKISETAFPESRLFSEIVISVTKELHLDPVILCHKHNKEEIINKLEEEGNLSPKSIVLLKKAHNIPTETSDNAWINDSGILGDLGIEFGGQTKGLPEFKEIIDERYPDAPEGIMEILKNRGIIRENGNVVEILNHNN